MSSDKSLWCLSSHTLTLIQTGQQLSCWPSYRVIETSQQHGGMSYHPYFIKEYTEVEGNLGFPEFGHGHLSVIMWPWYCCSVIHLVLGWGLFVERPLFKGKKHRRGIANHCPRLTSSQNFMYHCFPFKTFISIRNRQTSKTKLQRPSLHPQEYPANTCRLPTATTGNTYRLSVLSREHTALEGPGYLSITSATTTAPC